VEIHERLDELTGLVESARSVPMSASCVVNRTDLLALVDDIRRLLPIDLHRADSLLADADAVLAEARAQAEGLLAAGQDERMHLVSQTEVQTQAEREAGRIIATAEQEAERMQREVDDYIDSKLANFELVLSKTLEAVGRGRDKIQGRRAVEELSEIGLPDLEDNADDGPGGR
jgi:vacuolar-type H+-ATPase subunit H